MRVVITILLAMTLTQLQCGDAAPHKAHARSTLPDELLRSIRQGDRERAPLIYREFCPSSEATKLNSFFSSTCAQSAFSVRCDGLVFDRHGPRVSAECLALPGSVVVGPDWLTN